MSAGTQIDFSKYETATPQIDFSKYESSTPTINAQQPSWWDRLKTAVGVKSVPSFNQFMKDNPNVTGEGTGGPGSSGAEKAYADVKAGNYAKAIHRTVSDLGAGLAPVALPALAAAPLTTLASLAGGTALQYIGKKGGEAAGLTPDQSDVAGDVGAITGGSLAGYAGSKIDHLPDLVGTALDKATPESLKIPLREVVQKLTGTTPERIADLAQVENKVADAHAVAVSTEAAAKAKVKAAFPDIQTPVQIPPKYSQGGWQDGHFVTSDELQPQQIPFKAAQEQYSQLAMDARAAHLARIRGMATGFDEAAILKQKNELGTAMQTAADAEGKLPEFTAAKQGFMQFMNDFHNKGSAIEPLLEMNPSDTSKIVNHFLGPDKGARSIETLQKYGADVTPIQDLLSKGATPLKIDVNEAAKLRKVGEQGYGPLRLQESIDQATFNRLPSSAQARLPAAAMKQNTKVPYLPEAISPNIPTRYLTKKLLLSDLAKEAVATKRP
jgi:hypothetical protein